MVFQEAQRIAEERSTSVGAMIRGFLEELTLREAREREARLRIVRLCQESEADVGVRRWTRDELH